MADYEQIPDLEFSSFGLQEYEKGWMIGFEQTSSRKVFTLKSPDNYPLYDALRYVHEQAEKIDRHFDKGYFAKDREPSVKILLQHNHISKDVTVTSSTNCRVLYDKL